MTKEDKELLLKDLCGRLPCGVKCKCEGTYGIENEYIGPLLDISLYRCIIGGKCKDILDVKPYLFPLSSMTKEQEDEFTNLFYRYHESAFIFNERFSYDRYSMKDIGFYPYYLQDWLNSNHFDYRGLIKKGLAIDCTNLNIY